MISATFCYLSCIGISGNSRGYLGRSLDLPKNTFQLIALVAVAFHVKLMVWPDPVNGIIASLAGKGSAGIAAR